MTSLLQSVLAPPGSSSILRIRKLCKMVLDEYSQPRIDLFNRRSLRTRVHSRESKWVAKQGGGWELYCSYAAEAVKAFRAGSIPHVSEFAGKPQRLEEPVGLAMCIPGQRGWFVDSTKETVSANLV